MIMALLLATRIWACDAGGDYGPGINLQIKCMKSMNTMDGRCQSEKICVVSTGITVCALNAPN